MVRSGHRDIARDRGIGWIVSSLPTIGSEQSLNTAPLRSVPDRTIKRNR